MSPHLAFGLWFSVGRNPGRCFPTPISNRCSFVWLGFSWLATMARALIRRPNPVLVGLFAAALIQLWPITSTTGFITLPTAG
jgi:hypothetical protein